MDALRKYALKCQNGANDLLKIDAIDLLSAVFLLGSERGQRKVSGHATVMLSGC